MMFPPTINLPGTNRSIGADQPVFIVAEIGINHNGDLDLARRSIEAAARAGADAVKFQNYRTEDFLTDRTLTYSYVSQGNTITESQFDMFKRCELRPEQLATLQQTARDCGVIFFSTPTGPESLADLVHLNVPLLKNGSDFLVNIPLIEHMARTGIPTILSTGMATLAEIDDAVRAFRHAGGKQLILLHCTSNYPTQPADLHLRKIPNLRAAFGCPAGFSDHSEGVTAAILSVALDACFIEKHFTLDKNLPGPDHAMSSDPAEFAFLVHSVRQAEAALGQSAIGPTASEETARLNYRLSCIAACDIPAGTTLTERHIKFARPATGLPPALLPHLLGRQAKTPIPAGQQIHFNHLT